MEYAIAIGTILIFWLIFILSQPKSREKYFTAFDEELFAAQSAEFAKDLPLPKEGGGLNSADKYKKRIKRAERKFSRAKSSQIQSLFAPVFQNNSEILTEILKTDFDALSGLPSIDKKTRAERIAAFQLTHSEYIFTSDRCGALFESVNAVRTVTFPEMAQMRLAYEYVLLEKLAFICDDALNLLKMEKMAKKYAVKYNTYSNTPIYKYLKKNKVFMKMCGNAVGYSCEELDEAYDNATDKLTFYLNNVFDSFSALKLYDFTAHYKPLSVLEDFDSFAEASPTIKKNFLSDMSRMGNKENIDELLYAKRLADFAKNRTDRFLSFKRFDFMGRRAAVILTKKNLAMLSDGLRSKEKMELLFADNPKRKSKSILNNNKNDNTYAPYYQSYTVKYGISLSGDYLKIKPCFPESVPQAQLTLCHKGVEHEIKIAKGENHAVRLGGTVMHGVEAIKLGELPLSIEIVIQDKSE